MGLFVPVLRTDIVEPSELDGRRGLSGISNSESLEFDDRWVRSGRSISGCLVNLSLFCWHIDIWVRAVVRISFHLNVVTVAQMR